MAHPSRGLRVRAPFAIGVLLVAALVAACDGTATGNIPNTSIIGPLSDGSGGSAGGAVAGTYRLMTVNGLAVPSVIVAEAADSVVVTGDSTHIFTTALDSGFIVLHSDTTMTLYNYLTVREERYGPLISSDSEIVIASTVPVADTFAGIYSYNAATASVTVTLVNTEADSGGVTPITAFALSYATDSLSGSFSYNVTDLLGDYVGSYTSAFVYVNNGTGPTEDVVRHLLTAASRH